MKMNENLKVILSFSEEHYVELSTIYKQLLF